MNTSTFTFTFTFTFILSIISITIQISVSKNSLVIEESNLITMAENKPSSSSIYIIYTEPPQGDDHEGSHIRTLSSVLGSEEAAKGALIYVYKNAATGFSAKLTPEQVSELEKQPGVLQIVADKPVQLHSQGGAMNV